jgi:hypothetical protein
MRCPSVRSIFQFKFQKFRTFELLKPIIMTSFGGPRRRAASQTADAGLLPLRSLQAPEVVRRHHRVVTSPPRGRQASPTRARVLSDALHAAAGVLPYQSREQSYAYMELQRAAAAAPRARNRHHARSGRRLDHAGREWACGHE